MQKTQFTGEIDSEEINVLDSESNIIVSIENEDGRMKMDFYTTTDGEFILPDFIPCDLDGCSRLGKYEINIEELNLAYNYCYRHVQMFAKQSTVQGTWEDGTLKCSVSGCYNPPIKYIKGGRGSFDTFYCEEHFPGNKTGSEKDTYQESSSSYSPTYQNSDHQCEAPGCSREGSNSIIGLFGTTEYYCDEHYAEMKDAYDTITGN